MFSLVGLKMRAGKIHHPTPFPEVGICVVVFSLKKKRGQYICYKAVFMEINYKHNLLDQSHFATRQMLPNGVYNTSSKRGHLYNVASQYFVNIISERLREIYLFSPHSSFAREINSHVFFDRFSRVL